MAARMELKLRHRAHYLSCTATSRQQGRRQRSPRAATTRPPPGPLWPYFLYPVLRSERVGPTSQCAHPKGVSTHVLGCGGEARARSSIWGLSRSSSPRRRSVRAWDQNPSTWLTPSDHEEPDHAFGRQAENEAGHLASHTEAASSSLPEGISGKHRSQCGTR